MCYPGDLGETGPLKGDYFHNKFNTKRLHLRSMVLPQSFKIVFIYVYVLKVAFVIILGSSSGYSSLPPPSLKHTSKIKLHFLKIFNFQVINIYKRGVHFSELHIFTTMKSLSFGVNYLQLLIKFFKLIP